jgi:hypothetical protein
MLNHDAADDPRASEESHMLDQIEPEQITNDFREAAQKMVVFLFSAFNYIHEARNQKEVTIRLWAVSSAIEHPVVAGRSDIDLARMLGTTRANLSKHILTFEKQNHLPPTLSQKSIQARNSYSKARKAQLNPTPHAN